MANISPQDAAGLFTKSLIKVYRERTTPTSFLRSFFNEKGYGTKEVSIQVRRGTEKIAVDVERGTKGNRNAFSRSSEKIIVPPLYSEYFNATELDLYDRMFGTDGINEAQFMKFLDDVIEKITELRAKIERALELQCSQILQTGIVTLNSGDNIDFKRKNASIVSGASYQFSNSVDPHKIIQKGCEWIRKNGKYGGGVFNVIFGDDAIMKFLENDFVKNERMTTVPIDIIKAPQRISDGTLHGEISAGAYRARIWSYSEFYDTESSTNLPYIGTKNMIILPEVTDFEIAFALPPMAPAEALERNLTDKYYVFDYENREESSHKFFVKSCPIAIPVAIDTIYTAEVVA